MKAEFSKWDSDVFGVKVGILNLDQKEISIDKIRKENKRFDVVFVKAKGWIDAPRGTRAIDYTYDMELHQCLNKDGGKSWVKRLDTPSKSQIELARKAFPESRFLRDPSLCKKAPDLYERWLSGGDLYVVPGSDVHNGFILIKKEDSEDNYRIALIAVAPFHRGLKIGDSLISGVIRQFQGTWRVKVSARNTGAIRFYEHQGFKVKEVATAFHVWIKK